MIEIKIIKENLKKGELISGTGIVYRFTPSVYLEAAKFIAKKFDLALATAKGHINYLIVNNCVWRNGKIVKRVETNKKTTDARLKNIINLDYEWEELL